MCAFYYGQDKYFPNFENISIIAVRFVEFLPILLELTDLQRGPPPKLVGRVRANVELKYIPILFYSLGIPPHRRSLSGFRGSVCSVLQL